MDMDTSVVIVGREGIRGLNGNGKNTIKITFKNKMYIPQKIKNKIVKKKKNRFMSTNFKD